MAENERTIQEPTESRKNQKNRQEPNKIKAERIDIKAERDQPNGEDPKEPRKSRKNRQKNEIKINEPKESI
jgi:hypothetical protein